MGWGIHAVAALLLAAGKAPAPPPWQPALAGQPAAIAAAARAYKAPPEDGAADLDEEMEFRFDEQGRLTTTYRSVRLVLSQEAAEALAVLRAGWAPWHQARPQVRARVITPDGVAHPLDPAGLVEAGTGEGPGPVFSDRKVLSGPLPSVAAGAVIEEEVVRAETAPAFAAGMVDRFELGDVVEVAHTRVVIDAPAALPLRYAARGLSVKPTVEERGGRRRVVYEPGRLAARAEREPGSPAEPGGPSIGVATGRSWAEVAHAYAAQVDGRLAGAELQPLAAQVLGAHPDRDAALARLGAWLPAHVRYAGLELGLGSLVPAPPRETLARQFGDCKDLATLAVGLLRAAGIPAEVALVQVTGAELDPALPGLGEFDHAVVHLPGSPERWYDATAGLAPPGELPAFDQGRPALVAAAGTTALTRTPEAAPAANRIEVETTYQLAEIDRARATERSVLRGLVGRHWRAALAGPEAEAARTELGQRAARRLGADRVVSVRTSDPLDAARPLEVTVELAGVARGNTDDAAASADVLRRPLLEGLPEYLAPAEARGGEAPPAFAEPKLLPEAQSVVWTYRVLPPAGFAPRPLPASREVPLGPGRFAESFQAGPDGAVTATLRFEAPRRLSAAEATALRDGAAALVREPALRVALEQSAAAALARGEYRAALAGYQRLVALHPREALHEAQLAMALIQVGLGGPAREHARRAVALEPGWAPGQRILGWTLEHDLVGRQGADGADLPGALAAYRKATSLEADDARALAGVERLLLRQALAAVVAGTGPPAKAPLDQAIAAGFRLRDELHETSSDAALLSALVQAGRYPEARALAPKLPSSDARDALWMSAVAHLEGPAGVRAEAERSLESAARRQRAPDLAVGALIGQREYPLAARVMAEAGASSGSEPRFAALVRALAQPRKAPDPRAPGDLLARAAELTFQAAPDPAGWEALVRARSTPAFAAEVAEAVRRLRRQVFDFNADPAVHRDLVVAGTTVAAEPGPGGVFRVRLQVGHNPPSTWFAAPGPGGKLQLIGSGRSLGELGAEALRRADAGDLPGARAWLDWARAEFLPHPARPLGFTHLWPPAPADPPPGREAVLRAAAALAANSTAHERAAAVLDAACQAEPAGPERAQLAMAWVEAEPAAAAPALHQARLDEAAALLEGSSATLFRLAFTRDPQARCAFAAKRAAEAEDDVEAAVTRMDCLAEAGDLAGAVKLGRARAAAGHGSPALLNNLAWDQLFVDTAAEELLAAAEQAASAGTRAAENTAAAAYAEAGRLPDARSHFLRSISGRDQLHDEDWVVYGRLAEACGLPEEAAAAYRRLKPGAHDHPTTSYRLAQRWLARLAPPGRSP